MKAYSSDNYSATAETQLSFSQITTIFVLVLLSVVLCVSSAISLLATLYFNQANLFLADWNNSTHQPESNSIEVANAAIVRAISLHPSPPSIYYTSQGRIYEWQHYSFPSNHSDAVDTRAKALDSYQKAVALSPRWAMHHLDIAGIMIRQGHFDNDLTKALNSALLLAPYRPNVLIRLVELGFMQWDALSPAAQSVVATAIKHIFVSDPRVSKQLLTVTKRLSQENLLCHLLGTSNVTPLAVSGLTCSGQKKQ